MRRYINLLVVTLVLISLFVASIFPPQTASASPLLAVTLSPTKTDAIINDGVPLSEAADGKADPGEIIEYTVVIPNNGDTNATGVTFNDIIDLNTTLVGGSLNVSPLAVDDNYDTIGNTLLEVGVTASGNPAVRVTNALIDSLFDNDIEFLSDTFTLKSVEAVSGAAPLTAATESGGSVTVQADGTFSYTPLVGFSGADHFDYDLTDDGPDNILGNADDLTGTGRVTINVTAQRVWYVKNDATPGGLGRSTDPFDTLAEAQAASSANDTIYVFQGDGTTTGQNAGITLKNGQRLLGEGVALTVPITSGSFNGVPSPTTITLRAVGTRPTIGNSAGDGVSLNTVSIGASFSVVEIRGLNISGTGAGSNAVDVTTNSTFGGSFELADNVISAAGAEGIDVNGGGSGALTVNLHDNTVTATGNGIDIFRAVGAGSVNIIAFDDNAVTGATGGIGINIVGGGAGTVLFDTDPSTASYVGNTVSGGNTIIGSSGAGNGAGTSGMVLNNIKGDLNFTDLDIYTDNGTALSLTGTTSNFLTSGTGTRVTATTGTPTLVAVGGPALTTNQTNINIVPTTFSSNNSGTTGVSLLETSGTLTAPSGSSITNATGTDFSVDGNLIATATVSVTYAGTITDNNGRLVQVQDVTGSNPAAPTYAFTGAISSSGATSTGVLLDNNDSATIRFSGGLTLSTSGNPAFTATNGAVAVEVCDENPCNPAATGALVNTLTSTTATALNVANTTIGSNNLEFRSISSNGAASGIVLNTTGSGNLVVKGNGGSCTSAGTCTGGAIQNSTSYGISLTNTTSPSFTRIAIVNAGRSGIDGQQVTNFTLANSFIDNVGTAAAGQYEESNLAFNDGGVFTSTAVSGTVSITNNILTNARRAGIMIENGTGTISNLTISNNTLTSSTNSTVSLGNAIHVLVQGSASLNAHLTTGTISGNTITNFPSGEGIFIAGGAGNGSNNTSSTLGANGTPINITGNFISGGTGTNRMGSNAIRVAFNGQVGVANFNISNNGTAGSPITNIEGQGISVFMGGTVTGTTTVDNNVIVANQTLAAGTQGMAVQVDDGPAALGTSAADYNFIITNNSISNYEGSGIRAIARASLGKMDVTIQNNKVGTPILANRNAIRVDSGSSAGDVTVCMNMTGNTNLSNGDLTGSGVNAGIGVRKQGSIAATNDFGIVGIAAAPTNAQVQAFLDNPTNSTVGVDIISGSNYTSCATTAMLPDTNQVVAQTQPETNPVVLAQVTNSNLNSANTFAVASESVNLSEQASEIDPANTVANTSVNVGGGKPIFRLHTAPPQSETVTVPAFTLPAGKSVTIKFQVTVNDPVTLGTTQISNQGTVNGSNFSNVLTDDTSVVGGSDPTITPVDRPDANVNSINRRTPSAALTNADSVTWRVTFDTPVAALAASNFALDTTGGSVTTGAIGAPSGVNETPLGSGLYPIWDVTVSMIAGDGPLVLKMVNDTGLSHDVFVLPFTGETYTIDNTAPTTTSITCLTPACLNPTNADTLIFRVSFSEDVQNVGSTGASSDFTVTGTTATVTSIGSGDSQNFDVTVSGGNLAGLNGTVGLDFNSGTLNITDLAGNALNISTAPSPNETYTVDNTAPTATNFNRFNPSTTPTNADTLVFQAIFSEDVTGVDDADFTVPVLTGGTIIVSPVSANVYNVTISGGNLPNFNGTVDLNFNSPTITDLVGNALSNTVVGLDQQYVLDNTTPTVTINQASGQSDPTGSSPINFTVVFNEPVTGFDDLSDITLSGTASSSVNSITGGPTTYNVSVNATSNGTVIAGVGSNVAQDAVGNLNIVSTSVDNTVSYDGTQPTVTINQAAGQSDPTGTSPIIFTVTFSESVTDFDDTSDVTLSGTAGATTSVITGGPTTYNVAVSGMTGDGTVIASIPAGAATDGANVSAAATPVDNNVLYDALAPSTTSFARQTPSGQNTNADTLVFRATFSEDVIGVDTTDFDPSGTTAAVTLVTPVSAKIYDLTVSGGDLASLNGVVAMDFNTLAPVDFITDLGDNNLPKTEPSTNEIYTVNNTAPSTIGFLWQTPAGSPTNADTLIFRATFSENVTNVDTTDFAVNGTTTATVTGVSFFSSGVYDVTVSGGDLANYNGVVGLDFNIGTLDITDLAGNPLPGTEPSADNTYTADNIAPSLTSFTLKTPATSPTNADTLVFLATFSEPVTGVGTADFVANTTSTATVTAISPVTTSTYDVTISGGDLASYDGTVNLNLSGTPTIFDLASNALPADEPSTDQTYTVDNTTPSLTSFTLKTPATSPTNADTLVFLATFSEPVTSVDTADFVANTTSTATVTAVSPVTTSTYDVTISGSDLAGFNGTVNLNLSGAPTISDQISNSVPAGEPSTDQTYTVDNTTPSLTSFTLKTPATSPTNADTLVFLATFSEPVTGVGTADFAANTTSTATVTGVSPVTTSTYEVTISGGDLAGFNGTVNLNLSGAPTISDLVTNALPAGEPSTDQTYTMDNIPPSVTINQAAGQGDPTSLSPINFTAVFSASVTGFANVDVTLGGTAGATTANVTEIAPMDGTTYNVAVSGMTADGTVIASVPVGAATDAAGNGNMASTSTDNTVTFTLPVSDLTINKSHTGNFSQGQTGARYTITVSNIGSGPTNGTVQVDDALPVGLTATAFSGSGWSCTLSPLRCTRSNALASGNNYPNITLKVNVASHAPASVTNSATVSGGGEQNTANNTATDPTTVTPPAAPMCNGRMATIYVNAQGIIVGGPNNGQVYNGMLNGTAGADVIVGTSGKDEISARGGNDVVCGGGDHDNLKGGAGNDRIVGGGGNDIMVGESGNDTLTGGLGADQFDGGLGTDTATGFAPAQRDTMSSIEIF